MDTRLMKPGPWAFEPSAVDTQWWDFWRHMRFFAPFWEVGANKLLDLSGRTIGTLGGTPQVWTIEGKGATLSATGTDSPTIFPYSAAWEFDTNDFTIGYYGKIFGVTGNAFSTIMTTNVNAGGSAFTAGWAIQSGVANTNLAYQESATATNYDSGVNIQDGLDHLCVIEVRLSTVAFWIDGILVNTVTRTTGTGAGYSPLYLLQDGTGNHGTLGHLYYAFAAQGALDPDLHARLAEDPFGPIRMAASLGASQSFATDFILTPSTQSVVAGQVTGNYAVTLSGTNPSTNVNVALSDGGAGGVFAPTSLTFTSAGASTQDFTYTPPSGASPGTIALTATATGGLTATHTAACVVVVSATDFTITPSNQAVVVGGTTGPYTVTLNGPVGLAGTTINLSDSGTPGGSDSTATLNFTVGGPTSQTFTYTAGLSTGVETITGTGSGSGVTTNHSITATVSAGALTAGMITVGTITQGSVALSATSATGGASPYTEQWYRSPILNFTPAAINALALAGLSVVDTNVKPGFKYQYTVIYTDSLGATATATRVAALVPPYVLGFVGDSITNGGGGPTSNGDSPAQLQASYEAFIGSNAVTIINQGHSGSTTTDWLKTDPNSTGYYAAAVSAFNTNGVQIVSLMLGTNNARSDRNFSAATTKSDLQAIIAALYADVSTLQKIIIHQPPWFDGARFGSPYTSQLALLQSYNGIYPQVCDGIKTFLGDTMAMQLFNAANEGSGSSNLNGPGLMADGLHPNNLGDVLLGGTLWWEGVRRVLYPDPSTSLGAGSISRSHLVNAS